MNKIYLLAALALAPLTAAAYQTAETMEEAKAKAGKDGIVIVTYAEGWDKYSKKTATTLLGNSAVQEALGDAVVLKLGVRNITTKEEHQENEKRFGKVDLSFPNSYPAFMFYNKDGYRLADVCIPYDLRRKPESVARLLKSKVEAIGRQADLLSRAEQATGVEQANLLGKAAMVPGINKPQNIGRRLEQLDPENKSGMRQVATANFYDVACGIPDREDWEAALKEMQQMLKNPNLSVDQQQQVCCICIGLLRRHGGLARKNELKAMIDKLEKLDPDSLLGKSAIDARRLWIKELTLLEGWSPDVIPSDTTPVEVVGDIPMKAAGTYTVTLAYTSGNHQGVFTAVELYDGKKKVAEDRHVGSSGHKSSNNVYTLNVPAAVKNPRLFITFNMGNDRTSYGQITIEKK